MRVRFSQRSIQHLTDLRAYIARESAGVADVVRLRILGTIEQLQAMPHLGRSGKSPGTRELRVSGLPFIIVYRVDLGDCEELIILGIFRARQDR